jgi:SnoaL-like domain
MKNVSAVMALVLTSMACAAARADGPADDAAVRNRVTCYPFGIDKIGRGDRDGGVAIWKECFASNFEFSAFIGRGEPTNCPGASCPFPTDMAAIEMRAAFAKRAFDGAGFVKTSHHLTNVTVSFPGADRATVNAYVQAWHWKADNTVVVAPGTWDVELTRTDGRWLITKEKLAIVGAAIVSPPAAPPASAAPAQPSQAR